MANLSDDILNASQKVQSTNKALDYSPESLEIIEDMLNEASDYIPDIPEDQVGNIIQNFGCYILEVGRRAFNGRYAWAEKQNQPVLIVGEPEASIALMTWDKVSNRLKGDKADNIPFFYRGFAQKAENPEKGANLLFV